MLVCFDLNTVFSDAKLNAFGLSLFLISVDAESNDGSNENADNKIKKFVV